MLLKIFGGELSQTFIEVLGTQWIFTAMQSVHTRMNSSLSPPKKILDPPM